MTSFQSGEVVLAECPSLVILDVGDADLILASISTEPAKSMFDVTLVDWKHAGLTAPALVRLHKLTTVAKTQVRQRLGLLTTADRQHVAAVMPQIIAVWQNL